MGAMGGLPALDRQWRASRHWHPALAMLDHLTYPADLFSSSRFYHRDLGTPPVELVGGPDGSPQIALSNSRHLNRPLLNSRQSRRSGCA
ncbi:MAG: hypothetical protein ACYTG0_36125 [Planctomycetota bacterium]|jgi:hypothetical protein